MSKGKGASETTETQSPGQSGKCRTSGVFTNEKFINAYGAIWSQLCQVTDHNNMCPHVDRQHTPTVRFSWSKSPGHSLALAHPEPSVL